MRHDLCAHYFGGADFFWTKNGSAAEFLIESATVEVVSRHAHDRLFLKIQLVAWSSDKVRDDPTLLLHWLSTQSIQRLLRAVHDG